MDPPLLLTFSYYDRGLIILPNRPQKELTNPFNETNSTSYNDRQLISLFDLPSSFLRFKHPCSSMSLTSVSPLSSTGLIAICNCPSVSLKQNWSALKITLRMLFKKSNTNVYLRVRENSIEYVSTALFYGFRILKL